MRRVVSVSDRLSSKAFIIGLISLVIPFLSTTSMTWSSAALRSVSAAHTTAKADPGRDVRDGLHSLKSGASARILKQEPKQDLILPLALASGDFDEDGIPDLVSGYAGPSGGLVTLHRGNPESMVGENGSMGVREYGRMRDSALPHSQSPTLQDSHTSIRFLSEGRVFQLPEAPEFLETGDFNGDGHLDLLATAKGSSGLFLLPGDGQGGFGSPQQIDLPGQVTALTAGKFNRSDPGSGPIPPGGKGSAAKLDDVMVGIVGLAGAELLIFDGARGGLRAEPEVLGLPAAASGLALGQLGAGELADLAVVADGKLLIVSCAGRQAVTPGSSPIPQGGKGRGSSPTVREGSQSSSSVLSIEQIPLPFAIHSMAIGRFTSGEHRWDEIALLGDDRIVHTMRRDDAQIGPTNPEFSERKGAWGSWHLAAEEFALDTPRTSTRPLPQAVLTSDARTSSRLLISARLLGNASDDLVVLDRSTSKIQVLGDETTRRHGEDKATPDANVRRGGLESEQPAGGLRTSGGLSIVASFDVGTEPVTALSIRTNRDGLPGLVVLKGNPISSTDAMSAPESAFTVTAKDVTGESVPAFAVLLPPTGAAGSNGRTAPRPRESLTVEPLQAAAPPTCTLTPPTATNVVGGTHTVTCTVTLGGAPVVGLTVSFSVIAGPNVGAVFTCSPVTCMTNAAGQVTGTYTSNGIAGTDTIQACLAPVGLCTAITPTCMAMKTWTPITCSLIPGAATNPPGGTHTVTAVVVSGGNQVPGRLVLFTVIAGPNVGALFTCSPATCMTNASGQVSGTYTSNGLPGTDTIQACVVAPPGPAAPCFTTCLATKTWAVADLSIVKTAPAAVIAGNMMTYNITVTNTGVVTATGVTMTDVIPLNTTFVSAMQNSGPAFALVTPPVGSTGLPVTASGGTLAPGAMATFSIVVRVPPSTPNGTIITDTATVAGAPGPDPTPLDNTSMATTTVATQADLAVTKTDAPDPVAAGNNITYTIGLTNNGPSDAQTVGLTDVTPPNTTFVSFMQNTGPAFTMVFTPPVGTPGLPVIRSIATLAAGASATFTMVVNVNAATPGGTIITNTATATTATIDPTPGNNSATATTTVSTQADLSITKTDAPDPVIAGNNITYTITVTNNGPSDAQSVNVMDTTPANTTFVSATPSAGGICGIMPPVGGTGLISCTWAGATTPGTMRTETIVVRVNPSTPDGTIISNTATTSSATTDPTPGNNSATENTTVITRADLSITKTDAPDPVIAGNNITYTITVTNNGPSDAQNVQVTDTLPPNTTFVSAMTSAGGACVTPAVGGTGTVTCTWAGATVPGATRTETLVVRVIPSTADGAVITNTATTTSLTTDPTPGNNSATATTAVIRRADLAMAKGGVPDVLLVGTVVVYTLTVTNNGPSDASGVVVTDMLPAGETFVSSTTTQGSCTFIVPTRTVTCNLGIIAALGTVTITIRAIPMVPGTFVNTACVAGNEIDPVPGNNCDAEITTAQAPIFRPSFADVTFSFSGGTDGAGTEGELQQVKQEGVIVADFLRDQVVVLLGLEKQEVFFFREVSITPVGSGPPVGAGLPPSSGPVAAAVGDFNKDGRADVAVVNILSGDISILMGNGDGTFRVKGRPILVGDGGAGLPLTPPLPDALVVGDFDGDGVQDIVVANFGSGNILFLRGVGDGEFQRGVTVAVGTGPTGIVARDLDRDGRLDLAVSNFVSNDVTLLKGRGDGTFTRSGTVGVGTGPTAIIATDLNGDGQVELITSNFLSNDATILTAGGRAGFMVDRTVLATPGPVSLLAARLLTGRVGLAMADLFSGEVIVRPGGPGGQLLKEQRYVAVPNPISIAVGDFNGDGRLDLAVMDFDPVNVTVRALLDNGDGTFRLPHASQDELRNFNSTSVKPDVGGLSVARPPEALRIYGSPPEKPDVGGLSVARPPDALRIYGSPPEKSDVGGLSVARPPDALRIYGSPPEKR